jgi:hypothetical protein
MQPKRRRRANPKLKEATVATVSLMKQKPDFEDDTLFSTLKQLKPGIGDFDLVVAITRAKEVLFKPEYLTEELKQEMDEWDRIE